MVVVCKVEICPYRSKSGFCRNKLLNITAMGFCGHIYNNNREQRLGWTDPIEQIYMDGYRMPEQQEEKAEDKNGNN